MSLRIGRNNMKLLIVTQKVDQNDAVLGFFHSFPKFIPGQKNLEEKIRNKLQSKDPEATTLTPWEKYQEKRKQKRKESYLQAGSMQK